MKIIEETYAWNGTPAKRTLPTEYILLHHAADSWCTAQEVHQWHLNNGWTGIGYHYFVRKDGSVYRGRWYDTIGAHCDGYNANSVGICCEGNYMVDTMPSAQKAALVELCREVLGLYPAAKVVGHGDCIPTACPGSNFPLAEVQRGALNLEPQPSEWAGAAWSKAAAKGILDGNEPQGAMTREMLAVVLDRLGLLR